ncbi:hypothetical protein JMJ35_003728 [Cladonia borealis]|uniref:DUF7730 domain-containing protein n=1 Tax=Cladonia borealis TaxID=184061 RepID=A0AA39R4P2_9LECA|nr:hypothetical protein JMJ35_003728 [Cladonia borealis]
MCGTNSPAAQKRRLKAELAHMLKHRPPVSPPSNNDLSQYSISTHPQPDSLFFARLPPELRYRIYAHVLGNNVIYLTQASRRIAHQHYPLPSSLSDDDNDDEHETIAMDPAPELRLSDEDIPYSSQFHSLSLSLLRTCHAVYSEALPALYGSNVFSFSSPLPLVYLYHRFLLPRSHFTLIRHLRLHWMYFVSPGTCGRIYAPYDFNTWARFWEVVAGMELVSLGTQIEVWGHGEEDFKHEATWLRELMQYYVGSPSLTRPLPALRERKAALTLRWKRGEVGADFVTLAERLGDIAVL